MTNAARWMALIPVVIVAVAVPFVLAARDPLVESRQRLASMTPAQRKSIEQSRDAYDRLSSLDQYELRQLNDELSKLDPKERAELEALMGRLQAWVATFPDAVREKYDAAMPSERAAILKSQLDALKSDRKLIVAEVRKAEDSHRRAMEGAPPREKGRKLPGDLRKAVRNGSQDDKALAALLFSPAGYSPKDRGVMIWALAASLETKGISLALGREGQEFEFPVQLFRKLLFVPAFKNLSTTPTESEKRAAAKAIESVYLLKTAETPIPPGEAFRKLKLEPAGLMGFANQPIFLLQQLALLKEYSEGRRAPPKEDQARVNAILGKRP